eukprot:3890222-Amphidinium_carterae.1
MRSEQLSTSTFDSCPRMRGCCPFLKSPSTPYTLSMTPDPFELQRKLYGPKNRMRRQHEGCSASTLTWNLGI